MTNQDTMMPSGRQRAPSRCHRWGRHLGRIQVAWLAGLAVLALGAIAAGTWKWQEGAERQKGSALFHGEAALVGRIPGHAEALPTLATRCSNCHEERARTPLPASDAAAPAVPPNGNASYALALDRARLLEPRPRRGGPATAYDLAAFCRLMRTGADPARIIIATDMPRYEVSDEHCQQLWNYLLSR